MDSKITLSFETSVIESAKQYAEKHNISLSRLTEYLYKKMTTEKYYSIEDLPISDWVNQVSEGEAEYKRTPSNRKKLKEDFFESKK